MLYTLTKFQLHFVWVKIYLDLCAFLKKKLLLTCVCMYVCVCVCVYVCVCVCVCVCVNLHLQRIFVDFEKNNLETTRR
jgi:hydrogenase-4 membrane subunit HyfE